MRAQAPAFVAAGLAVVLTSVSLVAAVPAVAGVPSAVTAVVVRGAAVTPAAVTVSWTAPTDTDYAGARVVVVTGAAPTDDPNDPGAFSAQNVDLPATAATVTALSGGPYSVSVFGYDASRVSFAPAGTAGWTEPSAVAGLVVQGTVNQGVGHIVTTFALPANADAALTCALLAAAPPAAPAAPSLCGSRQTGSSSGSVDVTAGYTYQVAVFSWSAGLQGYGAAATGTVNLADVAPPGVNEEGFWSEAHDAHSIALTWEPFPSETPAPPDVATWVLTRAAGTRAPATDALPLAEFPAKPGDLGPITYTATGLVTDRPYTFSVRVRDYGGNLSRAASRTFAARVPGQYVADNNRARARWRTTAPACNAPLPSLAVAVASTGATHVAYMCGSRFDPGVWYVWRAPAGAWSKPVRLGTGTDPLGRLTKNLFVSVSPAGHVVVGWDAPDGWARLRARWPGHPWGAVQKVPAYGILSSLVQDARSRVHLLVGFGVYRTNASGRWTQSALPRRGLVASDLTVDRSTGRVVVALLYTSHNLPPRPLYTSSVRTGSKVATATTFRTLYSRSVGNYSPATLYGVAAAGGRVMVALPALSGPALMTGRSVAALGSARRVPYTGIFDTALTVSMPSPTLAVLSWTRRAPSWAESAMGIFTSYRRYSTSTGAWATAPAVQRTKSHYDQAAGAYRDSRGHLYVAYSRIAPGWPAYA